MFDIIESIKRRQRRESMRKLNEHFPGALKDMSSPCLFVGGPWCGKLKNVDPDEWVIFVESDGHRYEYVRNRSEQFVLLELLKETGKING